MLVVKVPEQLDKSQERDRKESDPTERSRRTTKLGKRQLCSKGTQAVEQSGEVLPCCNHVSLLQIEVEISRFESISFMNTTKVMEGIKEELRGLKLTALQNRLVLDQLTASPGVGGNCIQNMTNAINRLTAKEINTYDDWGWNWFKGLWQRAEYIGLIAISALAMILFLLCM